jgi:peroxiredoxin
MMRLRPLAAATLAVALAAPLALADDTAAPAEPAPLAIGAKAPMADVKMKNANGKDLTIASAAGKKGTLVVFTCNHCPWAMAWESRIAEIGNAAAKAGVGVVAINSNDPSLNSGDNLDGMKKRAKTLKLEFAYAVDATSDIARAFGATRTPEAFLFDAAGNLVYHGTIDDNAKEPEKVTQRYLKDAVDAVVAGTEVPMAETKSLGCSIKFRKKTTAS